MVFRVLVFGDQGQSSSQLQEWVENIQGWKDNAPDWDIVIPKCNDLLREANLHRLTKDQQQELFVRCAVSLDLEALRWNLGEGVPQVDLIIGIRQGATFVMRSLTMVELQAKTYFLIGGVTPDQDNEMAYPSVKRVIFANHAKDLIDGCPSREILRIDKKYNDAKMEIIQDLIDQRSGFMGYSTVSRQDLGLLLDRHRKVVLDHEDEKRKTRTKIPPLSHCFDPSVVAATLVSEYVNVIDDPVVVSVVSGMVKQQPR